MKLYKSTIIIWTRYDPTELELTEIAHEAESGDAYCSSMTSALVPEPEKDPDWDGTEFFESWDGEEDDNDQCAGRLAPANDTESRA
jgi:hypothetical protein